MEMIGGFAEIINQIENKEHIMELQNQSLTSKLQNQITIFSNHIEQNSEQTPQSGSNENKLPPPPKSEPKRNGFVDYLIL